MQVDVETVRKIAHLARLEFQPEEEGEMVDTLKVILEWMQQLNEVDTQGIDPLSHISETVNVLREDQVTDKLDHERALRNAPRKDSNYFRVPRVID